MVERNLLFSTQILRLRLRMTRSVPRTHFSESTLSDAPAPNDWVCLAPLGSLERKAWAGKNLLTHPRLAKVRAWSAIICCCLFAIESLSELLYGYSTYISVPHQVKDELFLHTPRGEPRGRQPNTAAATQIDITTTHLVY